MKKIAKFAALLFFLPVFAYAEGEMDVNSLIAAAQRQGDLSRQILALIFGDIINNPLSGNGSQGLLGNVIFSFNAVVIILATVYLGWITLKKTTRGAQLGQMVEGATDTGNKVIRTTLGFIALIPLPVGWNLAQLFFLWAASLIGVGGANIVSDRIVSELSAGQTIYTQPVVPSVAQMAQNMFETSLCEAGINQGLMQLKSGGEAYEDSAMMKRVSSNAYGIKSETITNGSAVCGGYKLVEMAYLTDKYKAINAKINNESDQLYLAMRNEAIAFNKAYWNKLEGQEVSLPDVQTAVQTAARKYQQAVSQTAGASNQTDKEMQLLIQEVQEKGWLSLGTYYRLIATSNTDLQNATSHRPILIAANLEGDIASIDYYQGLFQAYHTQLKNSTYSPPLGDTGSTSNAINSDSKEDLSADDITGVFTKLFPLHTIFESKYGSGDGKTNLTNPILKAKEVGDYTMGVAELSIAGWVGVNAAVAVGQGNIFGRIGNWATGLGDAAKESLTILNGWVFTGSMILLIIGGIMSVYIPLIPIINWLVAITDWIIAIVAGAVGSTLWAATHLNVGESNQDRSTTGYIFIIDVLIRPILMVIGFLFATLVLIAVGTLLDLLFVPAFKVAQGTSTTGLVTLFFLLIIYARIMSGVILRIFTLPVRLPNWVISWIGNRGYDSILGDMTSHVSGIFGGLNRATKSPTNASTQPKSNAPKGDGIDAK